MFIHVSETYQELKRDSTPVVQKDRQELWCTSCWGDHGHFPGDDDDAACVGPAPAAIVFGPASCLCVWCLCVCGGGLLRRENRRLVLQPFIHKHTQTHTHTHTHRVRVPGCGMTSSQMDHTQNHTQRNPAQSTHTHTYAAPTVRARAWQENEPKRWTTSGADTDGFLARGLEVTSRSRVKHSARWHRFDFFSVTLTERLQCIRNKLCRYSQSAIKHSQISHFTLCKAIICLVHAHTHTHRNWILTAMKWAEKGAHEELTPRLSHWPNQIFIQ